MESLRCVKLGCEGAGCGKLRAWTAGIWGLCKRAWVYRAVDGWGCGDLREWRARDV